jgi:hypothetical protein
MTLKDRVALRTLTAAYSKAASPAPNEARELSNFVYRQPVKLLPVTLKRLGWKIVDKFGTFWRVMKNNIEVDIRVMGGQAEALGGSQGSRQFALTASVD